jgi:hypothetical protein
LFVEKVVGHAVFLKLSLTLFHGIPVNNVFRRLDNLPSTKYEEISSLIQEELDWDETFERTQDRLSAMTNEDD